MTTHQEQPNTRATWRGVVLAESDDTVVIEGNHYFPSASLRQEHFTASNKTSVCPWKGTASYYDIVVDGETNEGAAWFYPEPSAAPAALAGRVAFWRGVQVEADGGQAEGPMAKVRRRLSR